MLSRLWAEATKVETWWKSGKTFVYRGNLSLQDSSTRQYRAVQYEISGVPANSWDKLGRKLTSTPSGATSYSLPEVLRPNDNTSLQTSVSYHSSFQVASVTGPNGASSGVVYDSFGRPATSTMPDGAVTTYTYSYNPAVQTATLGTRWKKTTLDGIGRAVKVETGHDAVTESVVETEYAPCACSPSGKVWRVSMPHAPGVAAVWTTYSYDALGRTLSATAPDGSATHYAYAGNRTTVTDPAGKWKTFTSDALGNLTQVEEAGGLFTYYTYDGLNQLRTVTMPRGGTTQVRTFVYAGALLTSATNPENGTVTYEYNIDMQVTARNDAKGQRTEYEYDTYGRLVMVRHYVRNAQNQLVEDAAQRVQHYYDTNPVIPGWSGYSWGRRTASTWGEGGGYKYLYQYNVAGRVTGKRLMVDGVWGAAMQAFYQYDNEGRRTQMTHPDGTVYSYGFDAMGRTNAMTANWTTVAWAGYGVAGEMTSFNGDVRQYNSLLQMTRETAVGQGGTLIDMEYRYTAGANNGRIASSKDQVTGEEVSYGYDALNRLVDAHTYGGTPPSVQWSRTYEYDGFGNLTRNGTLDIPTNPATNRGPTGYDANGALIGSYQSNYQPPRYQYEYDVENRLVADTTFRVSNGYDPGGKRVEVSRWDYDDRKLWFYGVEGKRLATYRVVHVTECESECYVAELVTSDLWFAGRAVKLQGQAVVVDRLGSVRWREGGERFRYLPYGEEQVGTVQDRDKFGTYFRDWNTGWDYADQRYYGPGVGRFMTPDRTWRSARPSKPQSWNQYAYVEGDPINFDDPEGLFKCADAPDLINERTFGSEINANDDAGLLGRVVWAESDNGAFNGFQTQAYFDEKAAVAVSIVNRVDILNFKVLVNGVSNPATLGWGPTGGSLKQVLSQPGQYASVDGGDITAGFRTELDRVLNTDATSRDCIAAMNSYQAALGALGHILVDPFGSQGVTTSFHHGTRTGPLEPYFGTFRSPNNFFGIKNENVVYNPSGVRPPSRSSIPGTGGRGDGIGHGSGRGRGR